MTRFIMALIFYVKAVCVKDNCLYACAVEPWWRNRAREQLSVMSLYYQLSFATPDHYSQVIQQHDHSFKNRR